MGGKGRSSASRMRAMRSNQEQPWAEGWNLHQRTVASRGQQQQQGQLPGQLSSRGIFCPLSAQSATAACAPEAAPSAVPCGQTPPACPPARGTAAADFRGCHPAAAHTQTAPPPAAAAAAPPWVPAWLLRWGRRVGRWLVQPPPVRPPVVAAAPAHPCCLAQLPALPLLPPQPHLSAPAPGAPPPCGTALCSSEAAQPALPRSPAAPPQRHAA